jgi:hypothetical protein
MFNSPDVPGFLKIPCSSYNPPFIQKMDASPEKPGGEYY